MSPPKKTSAAGAAAPFDYEFFGPVGAGVIMVGLIGTAYALLGACSEEGGCPGWDPRLRGAFTGDHVIARVGWFLLQVVLFYVVPGPTVKGVPLKDGSRLDYKINAHRIFWISLVGALAGNHYGYLRLSWAFDEFEGLLLVSIVLSVSLAVFVYAWSFVSGEMLSDLGTSGNMVYDFWMGRPKNPRLLGFDWKYFCELRPGLIGWVLINVSMACKQYEVQGHVDNSMVLVCLFHAIYVWDGLFNEEKVLTTADLTTEGFGFILSFGDLTWVPFTYTVQARYLAMFPHELAAWEVAAIVGIYLLGMYIFRGSNSQKDAFRTNPKDPGVAHLKTMDTQRGTKLIISGWWGTARHINYFGDWLMGLAYCLPCGYGSVIPYFYAVYFAMLLIHRELRDDHACRKKYGADWDKYCRLVKWRIVPYVY